MESIHRRVFKQPDRAAVQEAVIRAVETDPEPFLAAYAADPNHYGGRYVAADAFKDTFWQFRASRANRDRYNTPVHNAAAVLAAEQFRRVLADASEPARDTAIFLTGMPGAGKTSVVMGAGFPENTRVLFEGQMHSAAPALTKIQAALDAGVYPVVIAVHVTPEVALRRTFQRFEEYGRGASIELMATIQAGLPLGLAQIRDALGDRVGLTVLDNRHAGHHRALNGWQHLDQLHQEGNHERISQRLRAELELHRTQGRISEDCYRQANGEAPLGPPPRLAGEGDGHHQRDVDQSEVSRRGGEANQVARIPARAVAFATIAEADALARHPELLGAFRELAGSRRDAAAEFPDNPAARDAKVAETRASLQARLDQGRIPPLPPALRAPAPPGIDRRDR